MGIIEMVPEEEATGEVATLYERIRRGFQIDFVPNFFKAQAVEPRLLEATWYSVESILVPDELLPRTVKEMMFVAISHANQCVYCEAAHLAFCKIVGVDREAREALVTDLDRVRPVRTATLLKFAVKCGTVPVQLDADDYESLRDQGLSDAELQEAVAMSSFAAKANILADALRVPVDDQFKQVLAA